MAETREYNQFRRLVGDYNGEEIPTTTIDSYFNDATWELTGDNYATPVSTFTSLPEKYHNEVIYKAAINYWWNVLSELQSKHSINMSGGAAQSVSEKWERALQMIQQLQTYYEGIQRLKDDIEIGNFSRFSKGTLRRIGGAEEEDILNS